MEMTIQKAEDIARALPLPIKVRSVELGLDEFEAFRSLVAADVPRGTPRDRAMEVLRQRARDLISTVAS